MIEWGCSFLQLGYQWVAEIALPQRNNETQFIGFKIHLFAVPLHQWHPHLPYQAGNMRKWGQKTNTHVFWGFLFWDSFAFKQEAHRTLFYALSCTVRIKHFWKAGWFLNFEEYFALILQKKSETHISSLPSNYLSNNFQIEMIFLLNLVCWDVRHACWMWLPLIDRVDCQVLTVKFL